MRNKTILSWLVSYVVILFVPLVMGLFVYRQSLETIRRETLKTQILSLGQIKSIMDGKLDELNTLNNALTTSMDIQKLVSAPGPVGPDEILAITYIQKNLTRSRLANSFINDIYIYIENNNVLFSDSNKFNGEEIGSLLFGDLGLSESDFSGMLRSPLTRRFFFTQARGRDASRKQILYVQTLYNMGYTKPSGLIITQIDYNQVLGMMKNIKLTPVENILLINDKDQFIATGDMAELAVYCSYPAVGELAPTAFGEIGGEEYVISHSGSELLPLKYVSFIPTRSFLQAVRDTARIFYIYAAICIVVGILLAYLFSRRNHSPVKKLMSLFLESRDMRLQSGENEFKFLEKSMAKILEEHRAFESRLHQQNNAMRDQLFTGFLKGRTSDYGQIAEAFSAYGVRFTEKEYTVALISPGQMESPGSESSVNLIYFVVRNVMEDLTRGKPFACTAETDGMIACIMSAGGDDLDLVRMAVELIENSFRVVLSASVSSVCHGMPGIPSGYAEAMEGLEYRRLLEQPEHVTDCRALPHKLQVRRYGYRDADRERMFIGCMRAGDFSGAEQILDSLMEYHFEKNPGSLQVVKFRMSGVINMMLSAIGEITTGESVDFLGSLDALNQLLGAQSANELRKRIKAIFNGISEYYMNHGREDIPPWVSDIESYIAEHYARQDLSIAAIAGHFKLNASYLSRSFKKVRGTGLLDYIHKTRIGRAKELLRETELGLDDVAGATGYADGKALIRTFKKLEGITPGRYREEVRKSRA